MIGCTMSLSTRLIFSIFFALLFVGSSLAKPYHIVILGDPHLPGRNLETKEGVIDTINGWDDIDEVIVVGDVCKTTGTAEEYQQVARFFSRLRKKLTVVNGNHDYAFATKGSDSAHHKFQMAGAEERKKKLDRFKKTFGLDSLYRSRREWGYKFLFLSLDSLTSPYYATLSEDQLAWIDETLQANPKEPTIVFCHSPLWGRAVLQMQPAMVHFVTQPVEALESIIPRHKQLFLWVAGHVHLGIHNKYANGPLNIFAKQVRTINNCDLDGRSILQGVNINLELHDDIWTKSLFLHPDKVVIKVFDHKAVKWLDEYQETISLPTLD